MERMNITQRQHDLLTAFMRAPNRSLRRGQMWRRINTSFAAAIRWADVFVAAGVLVKSGNMYTVADAITDLSDFVVTKPRRELPGNSPRVTQKHLDILRMLHDDPTLPVKVLAHSCRRDSKNIYRLCRDLFSLGYLQRSATLRFGPRLNPCPECGQGRFDPELKADAPFDKRAHLQRNRKRPSTLDRKTKDEQMQNAHILRLDGHPWDVVTHLIGADRGTTSTRIMYYKWCMRTKTTPIRYIERVDHKLAGGRR